MTRQNRALKNAPAARPAAPRPEDRRCDPLSEKVEKTDRKPGG